MVTIHDHKLFRTSPFYKIRAGVALPKSIWFWSSKCKQDQVSQSDKHAHLPTQCHQTATVREQSKLCHRKWEVWNSWHQARQAPQGRAAAQEKLSWQSWITPKQVLASPLLPDQTAAALQASTKYEQISKLPTSVIHNSQWLLPGCNTQTPYAHSLRSPRSCWQETSLSFCGHSLEIANVHVHDRSPLSGRSL